jgi:hypothetical protein
MWKVQQGGKALQSRAGNNFRCPLKNPLSVDPLPTYPKDIQLLQLLLLPTGNFGAYNQGMADNG